MITRCPACNQLSLQDNRCYNPFCSEDRPILEPPTYQPITLGVNVTAVCSRCGALVADWGRSRTRDGWPNQLRHTRWHEGR